MLESSILANLYFSAISLKTEAATHFESTNVPSKSKMMYLIIYTGYKLQGSCVVIPKGYMEPSARFIKFHKNKKTA
jgi:hypothetical protein